jgi:hypothetical protein
MLSDCERGRFAHLGDAETAQMMDGIKSRLAALSVSILKANHT